MQSCLYFSRSGRPLLQYVNVQAGSFGKLLSTRSTATAAFRPIQPIHKDDTRAQSVADADEGARSKYGRGVWRGQTLDDESHDESPAGARYSTRRFQSPAQRTSLAGAHPSTATSLSHIRETLEESLRIANAKEYANVRPIKLKSRTRPESYSPATVLAKYLDLEDLAAKQAYWHEFRISLPRISLPTIVLHQLYINSISEDDWEPHDVAFREQAIEYLERRNYTIGDAERWAWILSGDNPVQNLDRLVSVSPKHPTFLLLEVLRTDIRDVRNFKKLLLHAWHHLEWRCLHHSDSLESEALSTKPHPINHNEFEVLIHRLLYQSRKIWPAATPSVARMIPLYTQYLEDCSPPNRRELGARIYDLRCKTINSILPILALPTTIEPYKSMFYNWSAQKVILNLAGNYDPPLILDKDSYRAVIRVLTASRKIDRESRAATFRERTWPPWRTEQDGMDAQRALDDDLSRALLAGIQAKEAGFRVNSYDQCLRILGGQELDGTPTIHTRKLVKWRPPFSSGAPKGSDESIETDDNTSEQAEPSSDTDVWAARVEATRDVREAWRAFVAFKEKGRTPNQALYLSIFQKLQFEQALEGRISVYDAPPGDGKEVLPIPDDNMSDFYKTHSKPPSFDVLYKQMLSSGMRPSGKCLDFLLQHAQTPAVGVKYLRDSGLHPHALQYLTGGKDTSISPGRLTPPQNILDKISDRVLHSFIHMICRFAPRAVLTTSDEFIKYELKPMERKDSLIPSEWAILDFERSPYQRLRDPLRQAARLLKEGKVKYRPSWYCLFEGLARHNVVLRPVLIGDPENDALAWRFTLSILRNFHESGMVLDPRGFMAICRTFFKFAEAAHGGSEKYDADLAAGAQLLKDEWAKLSASEVLPYSIPTLLHPIRWVHLHLYVRCLGILGHCQEIITVLEWMVQNLEELDEINGQDRNGERMLRRTLAAIRISCQYTEYEEQAMELVKQVPAWSWPDDSGVEAYTGRMERVAIRNAEPSDDEDEEADVDAYEKSRSDDEW
ncbi:hypothetical protein VTL71DRAFT_11484 [Oculimacula yallundae]|uniref:Uncharacterized protein n=1 Tax=Oculimacula yallundae TaxID=86028 RepID=A0ABR4CRZ4_9HELO